MDILFGILLVLFGLAITFMGLQVFFATLPLLGFILGFFIGTALVEAAFGDGFLGTVTSWIFGIVIGILFALASWFWWYAGVLLSAGTLGATIGTGVARAFGGETDWVLFLFAVSGFVAAVAIAWSLNLPIYLVIVNTAFAGAAVTIAGLLLLLNRIDYEQLGRGTAVAIIDHSWLWVLVWSVLAVIGMFYQLSTRAAVQFPAERWTIARRGGTSGR